MGHRSSNNIDNETVNALQAESIGTFTEVPPDLTRFDFGQFHEPAVSVLEVFYEKMIASSKVVHHCLLTIPG
jgi:hypothetical protein